MAYRNKTYVCFDADTDMSSYRLMQAWKENQNIAFNFQNAHELNNLRNGSNESTIKAKLRERMQNSKVAIVLIGQNTKNLYTFVRWEIEQAINMEIPLIGVNLNKKKRIDPILCPAILRDNLAVHVAYGQKIINHALNDWPSFHDDLKSRGVVNSYHYNMSVYKSYYPDYMDRMYLIEDSDEFYSV